MFPLNCFFKPTAAFLSLGLAVLNGTSHAATIINEDFQSTIHAQDTSLTNVNSDSATPGDNLFPGWYVDFSNTMRINAWQHNNSGFPQGGVVVTNQGIQFEYTNYWLSNDTGYTWSATDSYSLSLNATEQSWSSTSRRYLQVRIRETGTSNVLWSSTVELAELDALHDGTGDDWSAAQTFNWSFSAGDFTGGTENSAITFEVAGANGTDSNRGAYVDNISFSTIPEPSVAILSALGVLALLRRRR